MKRIHYIIMSFVAAIGLVGLVSSAPAYAELNALDVSCEAGGDGAGAKAICASNGKDEAPNFAKNIITMISFAIGMIAVLAIVVGGIRYATSNANPAEVKAAKDIILYAVIGLIVAITAFSIVQFVIDATK